MIGAHTRSHPNGDLSRKPREKINCILIAPHTHRLRYFEYYLIRNGDRAASPWRCIAERSRSSFTIFIRSFTPLSSVSSIYSILIALFTWHAPTPCPTKNGNIHLNICHSPPHAKFNFARNLSFCTCKVNSTFLVRRKNPTIYSNTQHKINLSYLTLIYSVLYFKFYAWMSGFRQYVSYICTSTLTCCRTSALNCWASGV